MCPSTLRSNKHKYLQVIVDDKYIWHWTVNEDHAKRNTNKIHSNPHSFISFINYCPYAWYRYGFGCLSRNSTTLIQLMTSNTPYSYLWIHECHIFFIFIIFYVCKILYAFFNEPMTKNSNSIKLLVSENLI